LGRCKERLDPNNGLLQAVHIDGLFDRGFISFDEKLANSSFAKIEQRKTKVLRHFA
jgi:hypothetical protein